METVTIPKKEYDSLKKKAKVNSSILEDLALSLKDIKKNRVRRVK